jgi:hypothetical protein
MLDFNSDLQIITFKLFYDLFLVQAELMSLELDLSNLIVSFKRVDEGECKNIKLSSLKSLNLSK